MMHFKICAFLILFMLFFNAVSALEQEDRQEIQEIIKGYTDSWNHRECRGFGDGFTEDADFVNIYGMVFSGRTQIEERHINIMQSFLKGSKLEILMTQLREVQPGLVIALVRWRLFGYRNPGSDPNTPGETREGIFTQVFIKSDNLKWEITASQNTLGFN